MHKTPYQSIDVQNYLVDAANIVIVFEACYVDSNLFLLKWCVMYVNSLNGSQMGCIGCMDTGLDNTLYLYSKS